MQLKTGLCNIQCPLRANFIGIIAQMIAFLHTAINEDGVMIIDLLFMSNETAVMRKIQARLMEAARCTKSNTRLMEAARCAKSNTRLMEAARCASNFPSSNSGTVCKQFSVQ